MGRRTVKAYLPQGAPQGVSFIYAGSGNFKTEEVCLKSEGNITLATSEAFLEPETIVEVPVIQNGFANASPSSNLPQSIPERDEADKPNESVDYNTKDFNSKKFRNVCMTLNNYTTADLDQCKLSAEKVATYAVIGLEVAPKTGTPHLQMYFEFANQKRVSEIRQLTSSRVAIFQRRGTPLQASDYCKYADYNKHTRQTREYKHPNKFFEYGEISHQGKRTDWESAVSALQNGDCVTSVIDAQPHLLPNIRALREYSGMVSKSTHRDVKVYVIYGESGSGKTRWAYENYPDLFSKPDGAWWDGYSGQKTILLDDFYGTDIPYNTILKVLDRYPLSLPVKGGFVPAMYDTVIITSNKNPESWYYESSRALCRRIYKIAKHDDKDKPVEFVDYKEGLSNDFV